MGENTRWSQRVPTTPVEAYDYIQWRFGACAWDPEEDGPWHEFKRRDLSKFKATMTRRRLGPRDLYQSGEYCHRQRIGIKHWSELFGHIADAKRETSQRALTARTADLEEAIADAIEAERSFADEDSRAWVKQLINAQGNYRKEVYERWLKQRQSTLVRG